MRVFICGATGVLGRRVVRLLKDHGHQVVGLSRSTKNTEWLLQNGAESRQGDLFHAGQIRELASDCQAIIHLATAIPAKSRTTLADWAPNDRLRREGTRALVEVALQNKCALYLQQSVAFVYGDRHGEWVDEATPLPERQLSIIQSAADMEGIVRSAIDQRGLPAVILRFGMFYCHDSGQTRAMFDRTRKGSFPIIGNGNVYWNPINVDDAASAVLRAIEHFPGVLGQTFNVCDDEPVTVRDLVGFLAQTLGARRPTHMPRFMASLALGSHVVDSLMASVRCRNQRIKEKLGWQPQYPTYREGYRAEIEKWQQGG